MRLVGAVTHDDANYVVDADKCNYCMDCIAPCPTGSIDNWRVVKAPYSLAEQLGWTELPRQRISARRLRQRREARRKRGRRATGAGPRRQWRKPVAPVSASKPVVNLFTRSKPAIATVQGNTASQPPGSSSDVRHIVLSFGATVFPVLEGQSIGIVVPALALTAARTTFVSIRSPLRATGEKRNANNAQPDGQRAEGGMRIQLSAAVCRSAPRCR